MPGDIKLPARVLYRGDGQEAADHVDAQLGLRRRTGLVHPRGARPRGLPLRSAESDRQGQFRPGGQGLRSQEPRLRGPENGAQSAALPPPGPGGDQDPRAPQEAGQGQQDERHPPARLFRLPQSRLHHLRTALHQPLRADQEEQVSGIQSAVGAQVCPLAAPVSRGPGSQPHHPL